MVASEDVTRPAAAIPERVLSAAGSTFDDVDREKRRSVLLDRLFDEETGPVKVDRFVIADRLGRGAMGRVYLAHDPRLDRLVALKLVADPAIGGERLLREARALAKLSHPNVVTVFESGTFRGQVWIAMEHVKGPTLRERLKRGRRPWSEVLPLFVQAGRGLAAAHARGLVHRDFKPENVFISDEDGRVLVGDFGLARKVEPLPTDPEPGDSTRAGTPAYMAPEQMLGKGVDARSDQYAFCVALFEALHGRRPDQDGPTAAVPGWLGDALARGLAEEPAERFPGMGALLEVLDRDPGAKRRAWGLGLGAVALVGSAVGATLWLTEPTARCEPPPRLDEVFGPLRLEAMEELFLASKQPYAEASLASVRRALDEYATAWKAEHRVACEATWVRGEQSQHRLDARAACLQRGLDAADALIRALSDPETFDVERAVAAAHRLPPVGACAEGIDEPVPAPDQEEAVARLRGAVAEVKVLSDLAHRDAPARADALVAEAREVGFVPLLSTALLLRGQLHAESAELEGATAAFEAALHESMAIGDDRAIVSALTGLAHAADVQGDLKSGLRWVGQAHAVLRRMGGDPRFEAGVLNVEGSLRRQGADPSGAELLLLRALDLARQSKGDEHPDVAGVHHNLGNLYVGFHRHEEALAQFEQALASWAAIYGEGHPAVALGLGGKGNALNSVGRTAEARAAFEQALAIQIATYGEDHADVAMTLGQLGNVELAERRYEAALGHYRRSLEIAEGQLGEAHPFVAANLANIGAALHGMGDCARALGPLRRSLELKRAHRGANHPTIPSTLRLIEECEE